MNTNNSFSRNEEMNIDIHCHPSMKPFGLAYPGNVNQPDPSLPNSVWHDDPPTRRDKRANIRLGVTRFSQANFTDLYKGNLRIVIVALYPIETGFFRSWLLRTGDFADRIYNLITGIGKKKIDFIQDNKNFFKELLSEYDFYRQLHNIVINICGDRIRYKLTGNYQDVLNNQPDKDIVSVVLSIEGITSLDNDYDDAETSVNEQSILNNISEVKGWEYPPFFITFSHHFNCRMGGHARSLPIIAAILLNQSKCMNDDLTKFGTEVIECLLSKENGRRIYIDVKHMSRRARVNYYGILKDHERRGDKIPIIVSHGALNGREVLKPDEPSPRRWHGKFNGRDINFYDSEIILIADSDGIFGLQIDDRQITNPFTGFMIKFFCWGPKRKLMKRTGLIWNQITHIAELLDTSQRHAWDIISLGTDYDGMVNPVDGYWTSANIPTLRENLLQLAKKYMSSRLGSWKLSSNDIDPELVIEKIFSRNALEFLEKYYR